MLLSTIHLPERKQSEKPITPVGESTFSVPLHARHSLASPSLFLSPNEAGRCRKSSLMPPSSLAALQQQSQNSTPQGMNFFSILAVGKMRSKAEQTKQFIKDQTTNYFPLRKSPVNLTIFESEIARIVLKVLMKPGEQRSLQERSFLAKTLKAEPFFQRIKETVEKDIYHKIFGELRHMFYSQTKIIYKQGDPIKKALLVLEGEIALLVPRSPNEISFTPNLKGTNLKRFLDFVGFNFPELKIKETIKVGGTFGLDELFCESEKTSEFLVIAKENTHFLAVQKETFLKLKDEYKIKVLNEKLDFLKSFAMFSKWSTNNLKLILNASEIRVYPYSSVIFKENDPANNLFLIKSGEIELSKVVRLQIETEEQEFPSFQAIFEQSKTMKHASFTSMNRVWSAKEERNMKQRMIVTKLCAGQFFGEYELFSKESHLRLCRATVKSQFAELYLVPRQKFLELSSLLNSLFLVKEFSDSKENWREILLKTSQKSLLSTKHEIKAAESPIQKTDRVSVSDEDYKLISHVKDFKLLDKEFQVLNGMRPIRGQNEKRPLTARTPSNTNQFVTIIPTPSFDKIDYAELGMRIWNNSPKHKEKRKKELERRVMTGKTFKKPEKSEYFANFMVKKQGKEEKQWIYKIEKMKIYKRLKVDKMFPRNEFFQIKQT